MPDPEIRRGQKLTKDCKHVAGYPLIQLLQKKSDKLDYWKDNNFVTHHLVLGEYTNNWDGEMLHKEVAQCFNPGGTFKSKYLVGPRGRLLRLAVKDGKSDILPQCFDLGSLFFYVDRTSGGGLRTWPTDGETLHYRGAENYPFMRDPTNPARGGSGYTNFVKWAFKRGNGGTHGGCGNFTGHCGDISWDSDGYGEILDTGDIVDGVIVDFPANDSFHELVNFHGGETGCCNDFYEPYPSSFCCHIISVEYFFCVYPEGVEPTNDPGA